MLEHGVALALLPKWMRKINCITANSRVMLYGNKSGILAIGIATPERRDGKLDKTAMRSVRLRDFKRLKRPLLAAEMRATGKREFVFRQTVIEIGGDAGEKVWKAAINRV